jgi:glutamate/aspartate transport system permease protein
MGHFDFAVIIDSLPYLLGTGLVFTLKLTVMSTLLALALGTILALMRLSSRRWVSALAGGYVNIFRALPLILIIFWFYFLVPYIVGWLTGAGAPVPVGGFTSALITFTLFEAAYFCEIMRAGIQSVPRGQFDAGYALGLNYFGVMRTIVLPQAFRNMTPVLLTQVIVLFQDTSLVYVLSLTDFLGAANIVAQRDGRLVEMFIFAAVVYFVISYVASRLVRRLQLRTAVVR